MNISRPAQLLKSALSPLPVAAAAAVLGVAYWLFAARWALGVKDQWTLSPNSGQWPWGAALLPLGVLIVFGGGALLSAYDRFVRAKTDKERLASTRLSLVALMLLSFLWQWSLLGPGAVAPAPAPGKPVQLTLEGRFNIIGALYSDLATEYFGAAYQVTNAREYARNYARDSQKPHSAIISHVATHPPGAVLFFYGVRKVVEGVPGLESLSVAWACSLTGLSQPELVSSANILRQTAALYGKGPDTVLPPSAVGTALISALILSLVALTLIPATFCLASWGSADKVEGDSRGLLAAALLALAPTFNLYSFTLDAVVACGVAWSLVGLARYLAGGKLGWLVVSGVVMALTTFVSIGALAAIGIVLVSMVLCPRSRHLASFGCWGAGLLLGWLLLWLAFPFSPLQTFTNAMAAHTGATVANRTWADWVLMNPVMWGIFCGLPLTLAVFWSLVPSVKTMASKELTPGFCIGLATLIILVLLNLSGNVKGEVERLWLFLLAGTAVFAVANLHWKQGLHLLTLQSAQTLMMAATLAPLVRPI